MGINQAENIKKMVQTLRDTETLCVIMADSTKLPYVECDEKTYDDAILLFDSEESAGKVADALKEEGDAVRVAKIPKEQRLSFLLSLFSMGVNAVKFDKGTDAEVLQELEKIVNKPDIPRYTAEIGQKLKQGEKIKFRVENPEFHLTAIYLTQKIRNKNASRYEQELKELHEEMMTHYKEGYFIAAQIEGEGIPILKNKKGEMHQPIFTDVQEFLKFQQVNKKAKLKTVVVTEGEVLKHLAKEASGIVVNPFGVGIVLQVKRNQKPA